MTQEITTVAKCAGSGSSVSRWNQEWDRSLDNPYQPGDTETCRYCGQDVEVLHFSSQLRETGFQSVGHLVNH